MKMLWAAGTFAMAALAQSNAPSYDLWFNTPMAVNTLTLPAGPYTVSQDGSGAVFTNQSTGTVYMVRAKVEQTADKNPTIRAAIENRNGTATLHALALPDQTELEFGD